MPAFTIGAVQAGYYRPDRAPFTRLDSLDGRSLLLPGRCELLTKPAHNQTLYSAATLQAQGLRGPHATGQHYIAGAYIEFENNGGAPVAPPTFLQSEGREYYDGLESDANRDYLRVSAVFSALESTDEDRYPLGNQARFILLTQGVAGEHGKPFSDLVSSRVYGGALVAFVDPDDPTQDLLHSRFYFEDPDDQLVKPAGDQIHLSWPLILTVPEA